jgi:CRP-like cAMP-binding protein
MEPGKLLVSSLCLLKEECEMSINGALYGYVTSEETYTDKSVIFQEGKKGTWIYVVLEGHVKLIKKSAKGNIVLDILKEGDIFGEIGFLVGGQDFRSLSAMASDNIVRVGILDTDRLISDYEAVQPQIRIIMRSLMKKLKDMIENTCSMVVASQN